MSQKKSVKCKLIDRGRGQGALRRDILDSSKRQIPCGGSNLNFFRIRIQISPKAGSVIGSQTFSQRIPIKNIAGAFSLDKVTLMQLMLKVSLNIFIFFISVLVGSGCIKLQLNLDSNPKMDPDLDP